ncbi:MAG: DUF1993 domain-containing protein [Rhodospirillales bacterium]|nr:DUF1993 domain-containing protein [Alphaproteobacteria bacterium]MCB9987303.1 DUF1993 domain-containing protein [Rhodospirillales bacterium]USO07841.1 MAG: DUF1993 domain-containing protein [Rhodospirillales bacterium]
MTDAKPLGMYEASIPVFVRHLENLAVFLKKGADDAAARNIDPAVFLNARLAPDMFALTRQVQIATDMCKAFPCRLTGAEPPSYPDTETGFDELQARIAKTIAHLKTFTPAQIDGREGASVVFPRRGGREWRFSGADYLMHYVTPNLLFHITTAYAILRHNGVNLGKADFLGM